MKALEIMAVAAGSGRVAIVFLRGDRLLDWRVSEKAADSTDAAAEVATAWITRLHPAVFVTEDPASAPRKGEKARAIVVAMAEVARQKGCLTVKQARSKGISKQEEAARIVRRYPELAQWLPEPRRLWDTEPWNIVLFEAMALAEALLGDPTLKLARALG